MITTKQQVAVNYLTAHPDATTDQLITAAGIKGGDDNQAKFIRRLVDAGHMRLVPADPPRKEN